MNRVYTSYGLRLVADGDIPGLSPCTVDASAGDPPAVRISLNTMFPDTRGSERALWYESPEVDDRGLPNLTIWRTMPAGAFHFVYENQTEFLIEPDAGRVWCTWPATATIADTALYLRGPILGFILRMRGVLSLHASAVALGTAGIAIAGAAGAGKSTTAAAFVARGYTLIADDVAALSEDGGTFHVSPGYPRLNLWPDAVEAVYGGGVAAARLAPSGGINDWWDKRYVDVEADQQFQRGALPLGAVYILGKRIAGDGPPHIEPLTAKDAFMMLTNATSANYALDQDMRMAEFITLGRLVRTTPIRLVHPPDRATRLRDLCQSMLDDYRRLV
jgi:hypothetical protein